MGKKHFKRVLFFLFLFIANLSNQTELDALVGQGLDVTVAVRETIDTDKDSMPDWWETQYGLNLNDSSDARSDLDDDTFVNLKEYWMGSDPTSADSPSILYVDINNTTGPWDGSQAHPFKAIQEAIDYANSATATLVRVAAGVYYENLSMKEKVSLEGENNMTTIIDGENKNSTVNFENINYSLLESLIIKGGYADFGAGIHCYNSTPAILRNVITANSATNYGGGIGIEHWSLPLILSNVIFQNTSNDGGAIYCAESSSAVITNDTIVNNTAVYSGGGIYSFEPTIATITNCILWGNGDDLYQSVATYSDIENGDAGEGNISQDPLFVDPASQNYHLGIDSSCINKGNNAAPNLPLVDIDNQDRIINGLVDMGADEYANSLISGKVILQGRTNHSSQITFELRNPGSSIPINTYQVTTAADGSYTLTSTEPGTYDLTAKGSNFLRQKVTDVTVIGGQNTSDINFNLLGGDADGNNQVNMFDFSILSGAFNSKVGDANWDERADFDGNGQVNMFDFSILSGNLNKEGVQ